MVYFQVEVGSAAELVAALRSVGVLCNMTGPNTIRMVTHCDVSRANIDEALAHIQHFWSEKTEARPQE